MVARNYGRIVNIASTAGKEGNPNAAAYSASKAGVIALTKSLGKETAAHNIAVNAITPAAAKTRIFEQMSQQHIDYMLSRIPRGRFVNVEEIAAILERAVIQKILAHLWLDPQPPPKGRAREAAQVRIHPEAVAEKASLCTVEDSPGVWPSQPDGKSPDPVTQSRRLRIGHSIARAAVLTGFEPRANPGFPARGAGSP